MNIVIVAFDQFTDIDVFLPWDLLNRVLQKDWKVKIIGTKEKHVSTTGLEIPMHGTLDEISQADAVIFASGPGTRLLIRNDHFLNRLNLQPDRQLIGAMCSGALILGALGLLRNKKATTYPTASKLLESFGVHVVEQDFVVEGNIATAAGCLAAQELVGWIIEKLVGKEERERVLQSVQPVGKGLSFSMTVEGGR